MIQFHHSRIIPFQATQPQRLNDPTVNRTTDRREFVYIRPTVISVLHLLETLDFEIFYHYARENDEALTLLLALHAVLTLRPSSDLRYGSRKAVNIIWPPSPCLLLLHHLLLPRRALAVLHHHLHRQGDFRLDHHLEQVTELVLNNPEGIWPWIAFLTCL